MKILKFLRLMMHFLYILHYGLLNFNYFFLLQFKTLSHRTFKKIKSKIKKYLMMKCFLFKKKKNLLFTAIACHVRCEMWPRTGHLRVTKLGFAQLQEEMLGSSQEYSLIFTGFKFLSRPKLSNNTNIFLFHAAYFYIKMTTQLKKKYFPYFKNMY
jgi:hypothetical protein